MTLTAHDHATLDRILANEADMAFRRRAFALLDHLELADGQRILDCGCGMGFYLLAMSRLRQLDLVGVDADPAKLTTAAGLETGAELLRADVTRLPFPQASFDGVLLSEVLEHLPDDAPALAEVRRVLRPGGVLAVSVPNRSFPFWWDPINAVWTGLGRPPIRQGPLVGIWTGHERLYGVSDLRAAVSRAGFAVEVCAPATHHCFPFEHFLVYGIGKPLVERDLLPARLRASADRLQGEQASTSQLHPFNLVRAAFRRVDRRNERPAVDQARTHVNVLLKARRPAAAAESS